MLGFEPVPKPVCGDAFREPDGITHTCVRAASWSGMHFHRSHQAWFVGYPTWFIGGYPGRIFSFPLKAERQAALATLTYARHQLDRNTIPEDHDEFNDAVIEAEKRVLFGRWRGWKYEART